MKAEIKKLVAQMPGHVMRNELFQLKRALNKSQNSKVQKNKTQNNKTLTKTLAAIEQARLACSKRWESKPAVPLAEDLPVSQQADVIIETIQNNQITIIAGETGSGKTTQIPKLCLKAGLGKTGQIACTQPRRIAAKSVAQRVADEMKTPLGTAVGYQVRFDEKYDPKGWVRFMTDGILLQQTLRDKWLNDYDAIIIDEAHERSLNIDFLLGFLKQLADKRPDLKLIITSATIDTDKFSKHFNDAPIINVSGRSYPVDVHYRPLDEKNIELNQGIIRSLDEIYAMEDSEGGGDVLIFLPGEREINEAMDQLKRKQFPNTEVLPLYARLTSQEQMRIFNPEYKRRIILSTNVAETSLTLPRIHYVIDSGLARISRYSARSKIQGLQVEPIAQDSANQRKGRCGRIADGHCFRLYSEDDFEARPEHTDAEILRTSLASVILQTHVLKLGHLADFPFIDVPDYKMINDGYQLLTELEALDEGQQLTAVGRTMAHLPIDVQLGRILIKANQVGALKEALIIVSALSIQDPRERPLDWAQAADKAHQKYANDDSDFMSLLTMWKVLNQTRKDLKNKAFKDWCRKHFISIKRYMEWRDIHRQLSNLVKQQKMRLSDQKADYEQIHKALLSGFISHVGVNQTDRDYLGTRNKKFMIFPGSGLFNTLPKWIMAAQIVHTSQVFARMVAKVEAAWIKDVGKHLIQARVYDPFWSKKQGSVMGYQRVVMLGMTLEEKQRVHYGPKDVKTSRHLFIEKGLVEQNMQNRLGFYHHNAKQIASIHAEEDRHRKKDLMIDQGRLYDLYDAVIPENMYSEAQLRRWVKKHGDESLRFGPEQLYRSQAEVPQATAFPEKIKIRALSIKASYQFEPGHEADGITVHLPLSWLNALNANDFEFLVPGLLVEKIETLIKGLPKSMRRGLIPARNYAELLAEQLDPEKEFYMQVVLLVKKINGLVTQLKDWTQIQLPDHLRMRFEVHDEKGKILKVSRNFVDLSEGFKKQANKSFQKSASQSREIKGAMDWVFGEIESEVLLDNGLLAYPAVVDQGKSVGLQLFETEHQAKHKHRAGIKKLLQIKYPKIFKQALHATTDLKANMAWQSLDTGNTLNHDLMMALVDKHLAEQPRALSQKSFDAVADVLKSKLYKSSYDWLQKVNPILSQWYECWQFLEQKSAHLTEASYEDMQYQLDYLIYADCFEHIQFEQLIHFPRFIKGLHQRIETALHSPAKEAQKLEQLKRVSLDFYKQCEQVDVFTEKHQACLMLLEEYRISLFAQNLGTKQKVSEKRLKAALLDL
ncbi:ATP-dependent RNA helicase HrpA [Marinicella rhabdoformis]|uniref:ATP-dependent RNA helicase HrpA n=1 Tax=Marinicella rhabdoformis TaxID=2580566 RepID=UPI0012AECB9A|nr:ATP-dependent RNA helicase HrpA [Marinicella rhabdoformis]